MLSDVSNCSTGITALVALVLLAESHHDASGKGTDGVWYPLEYLHHRDGFNSRPLIWRLQWTDHIIDQLVTSTDSNRIISNFDLELAGRSLHHETRAQSFDSQECTFLSKSDNLNTLFLVIIGKCQH